MARRSTLSTPASRVFNQLRRDARWRSRFNAQPVQSGLTPDEPTVSAPAPAQRPLPPVPGRSEPRRATPAAPASAPSPAPNPAVTSNPRRNVSRNINIFAPTRPATTNEPPVPSAPVRAPPALTLTTSIDDVESGLTIEFPGGAELTPEQQPRETPDSYAFLPFATCKTAQVVHRNYANAAWACISCGDEREHQQVALGRARCRKCLDEMRYKAYRKKQTARGEPVVDFVAFQLRSSWGGFR